MSERRVCRVLEQPRSTQRRQPVHYDGEARSREEIIRFACQYGRYGYRRITALLRNDGWRVNHKCVERIWRQEGMKVPQKQPKRGRLWLNDGSCMRLRPDHPNHVWSYDFVADRTRNGRPLRLLPVLDEYTREPLAIKVDRRLTTYDVIEQLRSYLCNEEYQITFARTMDRSLRPMRFEDGCNDLA